MKRKIALFVSLTVMITASLTACDRPPDNTNPIITLQSYPSDYVGKYYSDIQDDIKYKKDNYKIIREYDPDKPEGVIIRQEPEGGTDNNTCTLVVNNREVDVPDFVGKNFDDVKNDSRYHFEYDVTYRYDTDQELGVILEQDPSPGIKKMKYDGRIKLFVNSDDTNIPKVKSYLEREAIEKLKNNNLTADVAFVYSSDVPKGYVLACTPLEGTSVKIDSTVTLIVSSGQIPYYYGNTEAGKKEYTKYYSDKEEYSDEAFTHNTHASGALKSDKNSMVTVPDFKGERYKELLSSQTSDSDIIIVRSADDLYSKIYEEGVIIDQKPEPNTTVNKGSIVVVYVSENPLS